MEGHAPLYVKVSEYEDVLGLLDNVKKKVAEARDVIRRLNELKVDEDKELAAWNASLDEITGRIDNIDKSLSQ